MKTSFQTLLYLNFCFFVLFCYFANAENEELVRVRVLRGAHELRLEGMNIQFQYLKSKYEKVSFNSNEFIYIRQKYLQKKMFWQIDTKTGLSILNSNEILHISGTNLVVNHQRFGGDLFLIHRGLNIDVVIKVPIEDYVLGVVAGEMPLSWPIETLKAQAIAARSYVLSVMQFRRKNNFDVDNHTADQVYVPLNENKRSLQYKNILLAVRETKGQYLSKLANNSPVKTFYHSDCGGQTTSVQKVWGKSEVNLGTTVDPYCPQNPKARWKLVMPLLNFTQLIGGEIISVKNESPQSESRVIEVVIQNQGKISHLNSQKLREKIGFDLIKSTRFQIEKKNNQIVFQGVGYGHGVGLCQWGSYKLALLGKDYQQILKHYYPQARLNMSRSVKNYF